MKARFPGTKDQLKDATRLAIWCVCDNSKADKGANTYLGHWRSCYGASVRVNEMSGVSAPSHARGSTAIPTAAAAAVVAAAAAAAVVAAAAAAEAALASTGGGAID